jgi:2-amino-4-hydroxy-6-hydroxymethyldihydropteridine diphosphokinase
VTLAYFSLGSNIGDRAAFLAVGVDVLTHTDSSRLSSVYATEPVGGVVQDEFFNLVLEVETSATPEELLQRCRDAEQRAYRERTVRFGPRTLDCDVLLVGDEVRTTDELTVPHPRMWERRFVVAPLRELRPDLVDVATWEAASGDVRVLGTLAELTR